jgi:hypothetical protein
LLACSAVGLRAGKAGDVGLLVTVGDRRGEQ